MYDFCYKKYCCIATELDEFQFEVRRRGDETDTEKYEFLDLETYLLMMISSTYEVSDLEVAVPINRLTWFLAYSFKIFIIIRFRIN